MLTEEQAKLSLKISAGEAVSGRACAGTGKTTTAIEGLRSARGKVLALAFNKSAQQELETRLQGTTCEARTLNSLGHRQVMQFVGKRQLKLEINKLRDILKERFQNVEFEDSQKILKLCREARTQGIVPAGISGLKALVEDTEENWQALCETEEEEVFISHARELLKYSIIQAQQAGVIDFDDQIYLSALNNNLFSGYDLVVVDEAQDLNPLQHKMLSKFYRTPITIIGDPRQSIYGFRGAVSKSMQALEEKFSLEVLPLTMNFRCGREIIKYAQQWCPEITAGLSLQGTVDRLEKYSLEEIPTTAVILSRCNAPLLRLAFQFIKAGRWPKFIGRDIGRSLASTLNQITKKKMIHEPALSAAIQQFFQHQISIATERGQDWKVEALDDRKECLFAVLEQSGATDSKTLEAVLKDFATKEGIGVTLSSMHRAKGLEWNEVYWLDKGTNEKFMKKAAERGDIEGFRQEQNLCYVAATRAKEKLFFITTQREKK